MRRNAVHAYAWESGRRRLQRPEDKFPARYRSIKGNVVAWALDTPEGDVICWHDGWGSHVPSSERVEKVYELRAEYLDEIDHQLLLDCFDKSDSNRGARVTVPVQALVNGLLKWRRTGKPHEIRERAQRTR